MKEGWEINRLGEIADVEYGFTEKSIDEGDYRYVRITDINDNGELISTEKKYLKQSKEAETFLLQENDILMARTGATFAKVLLYEDLEPSVFASYLIRIKFREKIENKLYWYFSKTKSYWDQANSLSSGAAQPHFNGAALKQVIFSYPKSISEQQRIVSILDEAFAAISKAKANAEQNLRNAKELFESYLQRVFEKKGERWEEKMLGEVTTVQRGSSPRPKGDPKYFSKTKTRFNWITISDISSYSENNVLLHTREWLTEAGSKQSRYVDENEFIIAVSGSTTGKCCITGIKGFIYDGLAVVKISNNRIDPKFLLNYMMSLYSTINNSKAGATFPNINTNYLNNLPIPLPSLKEQQTIVRKLETLKTETQKLEAIYQQKINDLEELRKSILQKAFSGKLSESGYAGFKDKQDLLGDKNSSKSSNHYNCDSDSLNYEQD